MKVVNIKPIENQYINLCLEKGVMNDYLYESTFFTLELEDVEPIDFLYRRMFETMFLRRRVYDISIVPSNGKMVLNLSIAEAISFVQAVVPPVFKPRVGELYNSLSSLHESLKMFLVEESDELVFRISLFKKHIGLNQFDTKYDYDFNRLSVIRKFVQDPNQPIVDFMVFNVDLNDVYNGDVIPDSYDTDEGDIVRGTTDVNIHFMFNCIKKRDLEFVYNIFYDIETFHRYGSTQIKILNVFKTEFSGYCVEMYVENYDSGTCYVLEEIFKSSYKGILQK